MYTLTLPIHSYPSIWFGYYCLQFMHEAHKYQCLGRLLISAVWTQVYWSTSHMTSWIRTLIIDNRLHWIPLISLVMRPKQHFSFASHSLWHYSFYIIISPKYYSKQWFHTLKTSVKKTASTGYNQNSNISTSEERSVSSIEWSSLFNFVDMEVTHVFNFSHTISIEQKNWFLQWPMGHCLMCVGHS